MEFAKGLDPLEAAQPPPRANPIEAVLLSLNSSQSGAVGRPTPVRVEVFPDLLDHTCRPKFRPV